MHKVHVLHWTQQRELFNSPSGMSWLADNPSAKHTETLSAVPLIGAVLQSKVLGSEIPTKPTPASGESYCTARSKAVHVSSRAKCSTPALDNAVECHLADCSSDSRRVPLGRLFELQSSSATWPTVRATVVDCLSNDFVDRFGHNLARLAGHNNATELLKFNSTIRPQLNMPCNQHGAALTAP